MKQKKTPERIKRRLPTEARLRIHQGGVHGGNMTKKDRREAKREIARECDR
jgi:hypothetical protein